jgi:hypothetical protein
MRPAYYDVCIALILIAESPKQVINLVIHLGNPGLYENRFLGALTDPFGARNARNIYFGVIMGVSALLPTLFHVYLAVRSMGQSVFAAVVRTQEE